MKSCVILWDNDIGWCEKLQRELAKKEIELLEPEILSFPAFFDEKESEAFYREWNSLTCRRRIIAVVVSVGQLAEWKEPEEGRQNEGAGDPEESNPRLGLAKCIQTLCRLVSVPVILVTEEATETGEIMAFEAGACDYMERSKDIRICMGRILACGKKQQALQDGKKEEMSKICLNPKKQSVCFGEKEILLTGKEYQVFCLLWNQRGEPLSQSELLAAAWSEKQVNCQRVVDTLIKQLRYKVRETPIAIKNKYGKGYYITANGN